MAHEWIEGLRSAGVRSVAMRVGLEVTRGRSLRPCPACGAVRRGRHDHRGPVGTRTDNLGWRCWVCAEGGDAVTLAAWALVGTGRPGPAAWRRLSAACGERGLTDGTSCGIATPRQAGEPGSRRPPRAELEALWELCRPVTD